LIDVAPARWLLRRPNPDASARLFCFPYSGCGASMYHRWPRRIGNCEICLIQPPGRENRIREAHYETYEAMAAGLAEFLPPFLDRPFGFFGHCGGALPAVELAYQLARSGRPTPRRVFVSSQVAPQDGPYGRFLHLDRTELADELSRLVVHLGGTPAPKLIELGLQLLTEDLEANRRYRPSVARFLPCGITAIGWSDDLDMPMRLMSGWRDLSDDYRQVLLTGGHYDFLSAPPALLAEFERDLAVTGGDAPAPVGA
jgi:surfactin synthase thioesterase subunit